MCQLCWVDDTSWSLSSSGATEKLRHGGYGGHQSRLSHFNDGGKKEEKAQAFSHSKKGEWKTCDLYILLESKKELHSHDKLVPMWLSTKLSLTNPSQCHHVTNICAM